MTISIKRVGLNTILPSPADKAAQIQMPVSMATISMRKHRLHPDNLNEIRKWDSECHRIWQRYYK